MTPLESFIAEVKAAEEKATPGEWGYELFSPYNWASSDFLVSAVDLDGDPTICALSKADPTQRRNDADFIAHSRTYVPKLVRLVEVLMAVTNGHCPSCDTHFARTPCDCGVPERIAAVLMGSEKP